MGVALDDSTGSLADVRDARRALHRAVGAPWWMSTLVVVGLAGAVASIFGGALTFPSGVALAGALVAAFILVPGVLVKRRRRTLRVRFVSQTERVLPYRIAWYVTLTVTVMVAMVLKYVLPPATVLAYAVQFLTAAVLIGLCVWGIPRTKRYTYGARRAVLKGQGPPGDIDELISPCRRLKVCTALAAIEQIDVGLLAKTLQLSTAALGEQISPLVAARHVCTRPDAQDPRHRWIALTDTGRMAYSGHVRALLAASSNAQR
jgi:hypothetical protein